MTMDRFHEFRSGDQVSHGRMGAGVVVDANEERVLVKYADWKTMGEYDRRWFELHPGSLRRTNADG